MQSLRKWIGLVGALLPVLYCGGMVWYFTDMGGWDDPFVSEGLRPTIIGLSVVGLLFAIGLGFKIHRAFGASPPDAGAGGSRSAAGPDDVTGVGGDADAMIARYLAQRDAASSPNGPPAMRPGPGRAPTSFGRRMR